MKKQYNESFFKKMKRFFSSKNFWLFGFLPSGGYYLSQTYEREEPSSPLAFQEECSVMRMPFEEETVINQPSSSFEKEEDYSTPQKEIEEDEYEPYQDPWYGDDDDLDQDGLFSFVEDDYTYDSFNEDS